MFFEEKQSTQVRFFTFMLKNVNHTKVLFQESRYI